MFNTPKKRKVVLLDFSMGQFCVLKVISNSANATNRRYNSHKHHRNHDLGNGIPACCTNGIESLIRSRDGGREKGQGVTNKVF